MAIPAPVFTLRPAVAARAGLLVFALACVFLAALVAASPHRYLYDEPFFVQYVPLLERFGFTRAFLLSLTATVGPLYGFVQGAVLPLTGLDPVRMRLVNVALLAAVVVLLAAMLRRGRAAHPWASALSLVSVPMAWVLAGMALSEMPALVFLALSLLLLLRALERAGGTRRLWALHIASAVALAIACWGRQPYLLLGGVPALLAVREPRLRGPAAAYLAILLALVTPLFVVWKGLVPPSHHAVQQGISVSHALLSLSYTAVCFFLLAPSFFRMPGRRLLLPAAAPAAFNLVWGAIEWPPMQAAAVRILPGGWFTAYARLCGSLLLAIGILFLLLLLKTLWESRDELRPAAVYAGLLICALTPAFVAHQFSSRYTAMGLPLLVLAAEPWRRWRLHNLLLGGAGCALGCVSLWTYFQ